MGGSWEGAAAGQELNPAWPEAADRVRGGLPGGHCGD